MLPEQKGSHKDTPFRCEAMKADAHVNVGRLLVIVPGVLGQRLAAPTREELVEHDVLVLGNVPPTRLLVELRVGERRKLRGEFPRETVVLAHEQRVEREEHDVLVGANLQRNNRLSIMIDLH